MVPTATVTASCLFWALGIDSISRPVFADELNANLSQVREDYKKELRVLNVKQLQTHKVFVQDKLERVDDKLLDLQEKEWEIRQAGQAMPQFLPQLKQQITQEKKELESTLEVIRTEEIQLNSTSQ